MTRTVRFARSFLAATAIGALHACGGGASPSPIAATPATTPTPPPTPTPRRTISLDVIPDHYQFSDPLARLTSPQAFELTITPRRINDPYPSSYSHTVEVWFWRTDATSETYLDAGAAFTMAWEGNDRWRVDSYTPETGWYYTRSRFDLPLGQTMSVRVVKHAEGVAELFVNGVSMHSINDKETTRFLRARVVGTAADFSFVPTGVGALSLRSTAGRPRACAICLPIREIEN